MYVCEHVYDCCACFERMCTYIQQNQTITHIYVLYRAYVYVNTHTPESNWIHTNTHVYMYTQMWPLRLVYVFMYIHILESNYIHTNIFGTYTCIHVNLSMQLQCVCVAVCCRIPCVRLAGNGNYNMCCMATTICVAVHNSMLLQCVTRGARAEVSRNVFLHTQTYASDSPRMATVMCVAVCCSVCCSVSQ